MFDFISILAPAQERPYRYDEFDREQKISILALRVGSVLLLAAHLREWRSQAEANKFGEYPRESLPIGRARHARQSLLFVFLTVNRVQQAKFIGDSPLRRDNFSKWALFLRPAHPSIFDFKRLLHRYYRWYRAFEQHDFCCW